MVITAASASPSGRWYRLEASGNVSKAAASSSSGRRGSSARLYLLLLVSVGAVLLLAPTPTTAKTFDLSSFLSTVISQVAEKSFAEGELDLLEHYCSFQARPHIYQWKIYYKARVWCPGWTPIVGMSQLHSSSVAARLNAAKNFVKQALAAGLVTEEEALNWL
ncbi:anti-lipopolysaccharide factor-like [Homarus americanus]|uniref:anti-lipopolysaccharide factor-like n=1 Tax=Homarus americanus TaxID=6706 RepID=UPI001C45EBC1|nr:anti-lipopolysaccharide factor-like [Homarus americanus]